MDLDTGGTLGAHTSIASKHVRVVMVVLSVLLCDRVLAAGFIGVKGGL
jgi:hypothetical protein